MSTSQKNKKTLIPGNDLVVQPLSRTIHAIRPSRTSQDAGALVIGGDYRGLGIVRSLGRHGIPVWVMTDEHLIAATSRYCRRRIARPRADETQQVAFMLDLADRNHLDGWTIFPTADDTAGLVSRHHEQLSSRFRLTTPPWKTMQWANDKRLTYSLAAKLGLSHPWTYCPRDRNDAAAVDCAFPIILKPAIRESTNSFTYDKAWRVDSREELLARYDEACGMIDPELIIMQELIPGGGDCQFSFAAVCSDGIPVASVTARRTRQYPTDFGRSSSYVESVELPEVEKASQLLLAALSLDGLVEVEFKRDPRDGSYRLLDVNPRVWGWHTLGRRAGADFPYLEWQLVHGEPVARARGRPGVKWIRGVTDLPVAVQEIRQGRLSLWDYLRSLRGPVEYAVLAADDPVPGLLEVPLVSYIAWKRRNA